MRASCGANTVPRATTQADFDHYIDAEVAKRASFYATNYPSLPDADAIVNNYRRYLESGTMAEAFPAFSSVIGDRAGYLWIREYDFPGEERKAPLWTVFDPGGLVLGYIETPTALEIYEIGEDYILGRVHDELEVEYVQVWPLERGRSRTYGRAGPCRLTVG